MTQHSATSEWQWGRCGGGGADLPAPGKIGAGAGTQLGATSHIQE